MGGGGGQGALSPQCTSPQTRMGCAHTLRRSEARRRYLYKSSRTHEKDLTYVALELASLRSTGRVGEGVAARGAGAGLELSSSAEIEPPGSQSGRQTSPSSKEGWPFGAFPSFSELDGTLPHGLGQPVWLHLPIQCQNYPETPSQTHPGYGLAGCPGIPPPSRGDTYRSSTRGQRKT